MSTKTAKKTIQKSKKVNRSGVVNYAVGDFLIRIKNASLAQKHLVEVANTHFVREVAETLKKEGYLDEIEEKDGKLLVRIAYQKKEPKILDIKLISKPGLRIYQSVDDLAKIKKPCLYLVTTSKGVMSFKEALKKRLGGELIAEIL